MIRKLTRYNPLVIPKNLKIPGVSAIYALIGADQIKAISIKYFLLVTAAPIARQAGRNSVKRVFRNGSKSNPPLYGLKKLKMIHSVILAIPAAIPSILETIII